MHFLYKHAYIALSTERALAHRKLLGQHCNIDKLSRLQIQFQVFDSVHRSQWILRLRMRQDLYS